VKELLRQKIQHVRAQLDLFLSFPSPLTRQDKWAVLASSLQLKPQQLTWTVPWQLYAPLLQAHTPLHEYFRDRNCHDHTFSEFPHFFLL
jgi:hypothetical protein